jgi:hypothetical protein
MVTLDVALQLPGHVIFTFVDQDAILLNTRTNKYFALDEVGARLWDLLKQEKSLREAYQMILKEYAVEPAQLEQDLLELIGYLVENGLVELSKK